MEAGESIWDTDARNGPEAPLRTIKTTPKTGPGQTVSAAILPTHTPLVSALRAHPGGMGAPSCVIAAWPDCQKGPF